MPQDQFQGRHIGPPGPIRAHLACAVGGAALAALIVCTSSAARAGDDDDNVSASPSIYGKIMDTIGLGGGANIQYGERSPLVVPPTKDLPPPQAGAAPVPNWPQDPDIARRKQAKVKEKPKAHPDYVLESSRPLRPDELRGSGAPSGGGGTATASNDGAQVPRPKKSIFGFSFFNKEEYATFTGEPARTSLTDPPPGYMTPSPDQPYGIGPDRKQYKVPTVADRATVDSGSVGSSGR